MAKALRFLAGGIQITKKGNVTYTNIPDVGFPPLPTNIAVPAGSASWANTQIIMYGYDNTRVSCELYKSGTLVSSKEGTLGIGYVQPPAVYDPDTGEPHSFPEGGPTYSTCTNGVWLKETTVEGSHSSSDATFAINPYDSDVDNQPVMQRNVDSSYTSGLMVVKLTGNFQSGINWQVQAGNSGQGYSLATGNITGNGFAMFTIPVIVVNV